MVHVNARLFICDVCGDVSVSLDAWRVQSVQVYLHVCSLCATVHRVCALPCLRLVGGFCWLTLPLWCRLAPVLLHV